MQIFDAGLTNKNSGIRQQMPLRAKFRLILAIFSNYSRRKHEKERTVTGAIVYNA